MDGISEPDDILSRGKERAAAMRRRTARHSRAVRTAAAAIMAAALCTVTAAAVNGGWLQRLFGSSASVIEEDMETYTSHVSAPVVSSFGAELPFDVNVSNAVCDTNMLCFEVTLDIPAGTLPEDIRYLDVRCVFGIERGDVKGNKNGSPAAVRAVSEIGETREIGRMGEFTDENGVPMTDEKWAELSETGGKVGCTLFCKDSENFRKGDSINIQLYNVRAYGEPRTFSENISFDTHTDYEGSVLIGFEIVSDPSAEKLCLTFPENSVLDLGNRRAELESIEISPFTFTYTTGKFTRTTENAVDPNESIRRTAVSVTLADGRVITRKASGENRFFGQDFGEMSTFDGCFSEVVPIDEVVSVSIGDVTIDVKDTQ